MESVFQLFFVNYLFSGTERNIFLNSNSIYKYIFKFDLFLINYQCPWKMKTDGFVN